MSDSEYWRVAVTNIEHNEAEVEHRRLPDLRLKLMELADKVEAGVFRELEISYFANNHDEQTITVGHVGTTNALDEDRGSFWEEVKVQIPEKDQFTDAYQAFMDDANVWLDNRIGDDPNQIEEVTVCIGDNRSESDTTMFIKTPIKN